VFTNDRSGSFRQLRVPGLRASPLSDGGKNPGGIIKLADKCDSCVILQICGSCHDDTNDPEFRFKVTHKIDAQRHGSTRGAGTAKPQPSS
jgi:hypothetical protein